MSCCLILVTASYHRASAGSTPVGGHWLFPPSARGARMFESILHKAWWSSLFRLWGARLSGFAFATKEADAVRAPSVLTWKCSYIYYLHSKACLQFVLDYSKSYPKLQVTHSVDYTECFTSGKAIINTPSIQFHEKTLRYRAEPMKYQANITINAHKQKSQYRHCPTYWLKRKSNNEEHITLWTAKNIIVDV